MRDYDDCGTYINHLAAEHRRLSAMLQSARVALHSTAADGPRAKAVAAMLQQVRAELTRHFVEEETGGCLEEAVSRCPRIASDAERIKAEHPALIQELDGVIDCVFRDADGPKRSAAAAALTEFCHRLHRHEAEEDTLISTGFGVGAAINGEDYDLLAMDG